MNDCIEKSCGTLVTGGMTTVVPCGCRSGGDQGTIKQGAVIPADSFLQATDGLLEAWSDISKAPVAYSVSGIDASAATRNTSVMVYFLPARIQGDANLPAGLPSDQAKTALKIAGAIVTSKV